MRLKSGLWVAAYIRRCNVEGLFAAVRRHGAEEAGALPIELAAEVDRRLQAQAASPHGS